MDRGRESAEVEIGGGFRVEEVDIDGAPVGGCHCGLGERQDMRVELWKRVRRVTSEDGGVVDRGGSQE